MKLNEFFLFFLISKYFYLVCGEICTEDEGCKFVKKKLTLVPLIDSIGQENKLAESFDFKIIKVFQNSLAIYYAQDNSANLDTSTNLIESDLARRIPFSQINLDCGFDGNKICLGYKFLEIYNKISFKSSAIDAISKLGGEFNKQCLVIPLIDSTNRQLSENLIYICEENKDNLREFFRFKDKFSRLIDSYNIKKLEIHYLAVNAITLKEDILKTADSNNNMSSLLVQLDSQRIKAFLNPQNYNSKVIDFLLININETIGIHSVLEGIREGIIPKNWSEKMFPKPIDACCFMIPRKDINNFTYFCVHFDNANDYSSYECERKIDLWVSKINNTAKRNFLGMNGYLIKKNYKVKAFPSLDCRKIPEIKWFSERLQNIGKLQDQFCDLLQTSTTNYQYQNCISDKTDEITAEIAVFSEFDPRIQSCLDQCILKGFLDYGKVPINNHGSSASFLVLNTNLLKKKNIRKRK